MELDEKLKILKSLDTKDLVEKLKGLYKKRNKQGNGFENYTMPILRQLIKDEEATWVCCSCGGQLIVLKWSKEADLITCNNPGCHSYRNPVGTAPTATEDKK